MQGSGIGGLCVLRCINGDLLSVRMGKLLSHFERTITWERERKKRR